MTIKKTSKMSPSPLIILVQIVRVNNFKTLRDSKQELFN